VSKEVHYFMKDNGTRIPVSDDYLLPFLSPTAKGTHFRESPPAGDINERQQGRVLLQIHQLLHLLQEYGIGLKHKEMLDVGTGDGLIPCLMLELSDLKSAVGADPFLDGEHTTSWQPHDHNKALRDLMGFLKKYCSGEINFERYRHLIGYENYSMRPGNVPYHEQPPKQYRFEQVGAHDLDQIGQSFDLLYCKAIEHIHDWDGVFRSFASVAKEDAVVCFKHRSFFSYLGPHRYASINIPWGHLLLGDEEYARFVDEHYGEQAEKMKKFYFEDLTYPRQTVSDLVQIASRHRFAPIAVITEPTRYIDQVFRFTLEIENFWDLVRENHPGVTTDEVFSGMHHILLRKLA
jgi:hypothetical protein